VKRALPHATQVADHYHLVQNLREHLQRFLDRKRPCLPEVEDIPLKAVSASDQSCGGSLHDQMGTVTRTVSAGAPPAERTDQEQIRPTVPHMLMDQEVELATLTYAERKKKISRDKRLARYEHVLALHRAGMGQRAVAWRTELPPRFRQGSPRKQRLAPKPKKRRLSSRGASFLMILPPSKRTQAQQHQVEQMNLNEDLRAVYPPSPGVCDHAQRPPGGGIGLLARPSQILSCD
jgi:hypothetical protein